MIDLLNNDFFDNERNVLNADLFVSNLKNTLSSFKFNTKITYEVYLMVTVYHVSWNDDKSYDDICNLKREIGLALGLHESDVDIKKVRDNEVLIKVDNMKRPILSLKELLYNFERKGDVMIPLGLSEYDEVVSLDLDKDGSLLVGGTTGIGKTNLFNGMILSTLINYPDIDIIIMDSQGINYNVYNGVIEVINKEDAIISRVHELRCEFEKRVKSGNKKKILVFIDEVYEILKEDMQVKSDINYLLELGSSVGIHLVISTDSIMEDDINDLFEGKKGSKLSFYLTTRGEMHDFIGRVVNGKMGNDGMYLNGDKRLSKVCIPLIDDKEIERVTEYVKKEKEK